jgi:hypothetical protein
MERRESAARKAELLMSTKRHPFRVARWYTYFRTQNPNLGKFLEGLGMEKVGIFFGHLEYIAAIWCILCPFGNLVAIWYIFHRFGILCQEKSDNPA